MRTDPVDALFLPGFEPAGVPPAIEPAGAPPAIEPAGAPPVPAALVTATPGPGPVTPVATGPGAAGPGAADPGVASAGEVPFRVEVTRSARRRRTVGAQLVGPVLRLAIPSWMSTAEEAHWVDEMSARFRRKLSADRIDLVERATTLARRFDLSRPREIRWADDMTTRWGSCTPSTGTIRISTRIARFPDWVVDYVIVHEIAHLDVPGHGDDFWSLVRRYPRAERAIGYLIAKSADDDDG